MEELRPELRPRGVRGDALEKGEGAQPQLSTPTFALRRRFLRLQYQTEIRRLYAEELGEGDHGRNGAAAVEEEASDAFEAAVAAQKKERPPASGGAAPEEKLSPRLRNGHPQPEWLSADAEKWLEANNGNGGNEHG